MPGSRHLEFPKPRELEAKQKPPACLPRAPRSIRLFLPHPTPLITPKTSSLGVTAFSLERPPRAFASLRYPCVPWKSKGQIR
jgi:hypothetical protein